ncbi:MAG: DUF2807 domain-containing protein [Prevotellaceae bacterium]|jgi:hypothetical protein|nr:DUF2807 domain-containing protein [Prevotellaceae bacterium]
MKNFLATLALVYVSFFCTMSCVAKTMVKEGRETGVFREVGIESGIDVYFTQSDSYSVVVETDKKYIDEIITEVNGEALVISWRKSIGNVFGSRDSKVYVSAPTLDKVSASGGADFYADSLKCSVSFQLRTSGGADANIANLTVAQNADISASGGADVDISNLTVAGNTSISAAGGADCSVRNLQTADCTLSVSGGSDLSVKVTASGTLNATASGGADINVSGKVNNVNVSASGGSDVNLEVLTYTNISIKKSGGSDVHQ